MERRRQHVDINHGSISVKQMMLMMLLHGGEKQQA